MLDMFQKLLAMERRGSSSVARFFRDHPGTEDRINDISGRINRMGRTSGIVDDPEYQVARRRMGG
jgi:predicted Zn-dependent protease